MEKNQELYDEMSKRMAVINKKFPQNIEAPKSIRREYELLDRMRVFLINGMQGKKEGTRICSDGSEIRWDHVNAYEFDAKQVSEAREENDKNNYISLEDMESFQYPEIDFEELLKRAMSIQTMDDYKSMKSELKDINQHLLPMDMQRQYTEVMSKLTDRAMIHLDLYGDAAKSRKVNEPNLTVPVEVSESMLQKIYRNARVRISETLSKLGSMFSRQQQEKDNENDKDDR